MIFIGMESMEAWPTSTILRSMEQGRLGLYGPHPAEIHPATQRVSVVTAVTVPESMTLCRTRRGPRSIYADDLGSEEDRTAGGLGPGAADPERALSAHS